MFLLKIKDKNIDANDNKLIIIIWYLSDYQQLRANNQNWLYLILSSLIQT